MKKIALLVPLAAAGITLAACGTGDLDAASPAATTAPTTTQAAPTTTATPDPVATCKGYFGDLSDSTLAERIPDALTHVPSNIGPDDMATYTQIDDDLDQLIAAAPSGLAADLTMIQKPFEQITTATSGSLHLDTTPLKKGFRQLSQDCADAGFTIDGAAPTATTQAPEAGAQGDEESSVSPEVRNAESAAESYLSMQGFSKNGLIEQLESRAGDGYTHAQAVYGANKAYK